MHNADSRSTHDADSSEQAALTEVPGADRLTVQRKDGRDVSVRRLGRKPV